MINGLILVGSGAVSGATLGQPRASKREAVTDDSPFGIATSASSSRILSRWLPAIGATGVRWLRGFDTSAVPEGLATAAAAHVQVAGILMWSPAGKPLSFPVADLSRWSAYVSDLVRRCKGRVHHWEVWNEPPNFTDDKSPASYARIVVAAYDAAKRVDPTVQIGLAAQSNNVRWLEDTIVAGARDHFDYVTVHPYELLDDVAHGGEAMFMSVVPTLRKMLSAQDPKRATVPIWFTELGEPVEKTNTPEHQAVTVIKAYTLGLAQGVARIHWFEGQDGDSGPFGLLDGHGEKRPSYAALSRLIQSLGERPTYRGWVLIDQGVYGFVFGGRKPGSPAVMVAWAPPHVTKQVSLGNAVTVIDLVSGNTTTGKSIVFTDSPVIVEGPAEDWVKQAVSNAGRPLRWGDDFSSARSVSISAAEGEKGLHQFAEPPLVTIGRDPARDASHSQAQAFSVDPGFLSYETVPIRITVTVRRNGAANAGFNLKYESTSGWKASGGWYTIPAGDEWITRDYVITDDQFVGKWGFNFSLDSDATVHSQYSILKVTVTKVR